MSVMRKFLSHILFGVAVVLMCSCNGGGGAVDDAVPSVYYWRTVFRLDSAEAHFLSQHGVGRMYVRYFDVVVSDSTVTPNATIKFSQPVPQGVEIIPTVFIVENCLRHDMTGVAEKLVKRVLQMNETNDVPGVKELQIDCDWTATSQQQYYSFLNEVRALLKDKGMRLSATIRLHQLSMTPPPVDYGVLMMYNTGDIKQKNGRNPILDYRDVYPYVKNLKGYDLALCAAWPCYSWNLLYSDKSFKGILYDVDLTDSTVYREASPGRWAVIASRGLPEPNSNGSDMTWVNVGDSVIKMCPEPSQVLRIARAVEEQRPGINSQVVIYSLDSKNFENYDNEFFKAIYRR